MEQTGSRDVARAALLLAITRTREEEREQRGFWLTQGVQVTAVDFGGDFVPSVMRMVERAVVAAKRENLIGETFQEEGAVGGAAHEAITQITGKALGLNIGGKIGVARCGVHVAVALFMGVGLVHLNEVCVGMGHRVI
ncbi:MAG: HutP family protein [Oscillospiraceae bacterium]|nr:HutP family protein [Oscillospiraceae bacterium]